jgi:branched-chain amino acid transport system ATP-binding protein
MQTETRTTVLSLDSVTAGYGGIAAVRDLTIDVAAGEVLALLGPNGAGKSTTLKAIMGLLPLSAGSVSFPRLELRRPRTSSLARAGVVFVPDDRGLCPGLTVAEHFLLAGRKRRTDDVDFVLESFPQLRGLRGRPAGLLSGGEQQMLTIAKAVLARPKVLLIDEMSLGLSPRIVAEMFPDIRELARQRGIGVVLVEQHTDVALMHADTAVVLNHGTAVLEGTAADLVDDRARVQAAYFDA